MKVIIHQVSVFLSGHSNWELNNIYFIHNILSTESITSHELSNMITCTILFSVKRRQFFPVTSLDPPTTILFSGISQQSNQHSTASGIAFEKSHGSCGRQDQGVRGDELGDLIQPSEETNWVNEGPQLGGLNRVNWLASGLRSC